jgi:Tfp pilus assembly protein PilN
MNIEINLLPPEKKKEIQTAKQFRAVLGWEAVIFSVGIIFFGFIFGINYLLNLNLQLVSKSKGSEVSGSQYETIKYYENKFSEINTKISKISNVANDQIYWSILFSKLENAIPDNVTLDGLSTKNFSVYLAGKAKTRDDLLIFRDNLTKEECFDNMNLPLSNLVSKEDIVFQIDMEIKENCIKNK